MMIRRLMVLAVCLAVVFGGIFSAVRFCRNERIPSLVDSREFKSVREVIECLLADLGTLVVVADDRTGQLRDVVTHHSWY